eukprot:TRINITY_DN3853_c0_g1_i3.p1 TRINITY_DN3853_c0_g1~~TRINITY_DN3853_c0_g1_i3.p1  ORF type:complete len:1212 (+),score=266.60 TRINITY_DN3853_c0_g1_i3:120-3755(+)
MTNKKGNNGKKKGGPGSSGGGTPTSAPQPQRSAPPPTAQRPPQREWEKGKGGGKGDWKGDHKGDYRRKGQGPPARGADAPWRAQGWGSARGEAPWRGEDRRGGYRDWDWGEWDEGWGSRRAGAGRDWDWGERGGDGYWDRPRREAPRREYDEGRPRRREEPGDAESPAHGRPPPQMTGKWADDEDSPPRSGRYSSPPESRRDRLWQRGDPDRAARDPHEGRPRGEPPVDRWGAAGGPRRSGEGARRGDSPEQRRRPPPADPWQAAAPPAVRPELDLGSWGMPQRHTTPPRNPSPPPERWQPERPERWPERPADGGPRGGHCGAAAAAGVGPPRTRSPPRLFGAPPGYRPPPSPEMPPQHGHSYGHGPMSPPPLQNPPMPESPDGPPPLQQQRRPPPAGDYPHSYPSYGPPPQQQQQQQQAYVYLPQARGPQQQPPPGYAEYPQQPPGPVYAPGAVGYPPAAPPGYGPPQAPPGPQYAPQHYPPPQQAPPPQHPPQPQYPDRAPLTSATIQHGGRDVTVRIDPNGLTYFSEPSVAPKSQPARPPLPEIDGITGRPMDQQPPPEREGVSMVCRRGMMYFKEESTPTSGPQLLSPPSVQAPAPSPMSVPASAAVDDPMVPVAETSTVPSWLEDQADPSRAAEQEAPAEAAAAAGAPAEGDGDHPVPHVRLLRNPVTGELLNAALEHHVANQPAEQPGAAAEQPEAEAARQDGGTQLYAAPAQPSPRTPPGSPDACPAPVSSPTSPNRGAEAPSEQQRASAEIPARSELERAATALPAPAPAPGAAPASSLVPAPASAPPVCGLFRSAGAWRPKALCRAEKCPDDYVSEQQRQEEQEAADDVVLILPHLYLSAYQGAGAKRKLQQGGVTHILCLDAELKAKHAGAFTYKIIDLQDDVYTDILARIPEALAFIQQARQDGGGCLVHCEKGRSRSVTTVLAWLMLRGRQDLRPAWAKVQAARPHVCPNRAFKRQLLRLQQMAHTGGENFQEHPLYAFHQVELSLINTKPAMEVQNNLHLCVDPAEYAEVEQSAGGGGQALKGLVCAKCRRVIASPLNLLWVGGELWNGPGTGPAASSDDHFPGPDAITEVVHGALAADPEPESPGGSPHSPSPDTAGEVHCPGCRTSIGSRHCCTTAVAYANKREPDSGAWQSAVGALAAGAPEALLPQWCALLDRGRTCLAVVAPIPCNSDGIPVVPPPAAALGNGGAQRNNPAAD